MLLMCFCFEQLYLLVDVLVSKCYCTLGKRHKVIVGTPHGKPGNPKELTRVWKQDPDYKIAYITLVTNCSQSDHSIY